MARILIFSGADPYSDPWHPFAETSAAVAALLGGRGHDVVVRDSEPGSLTDLGAFDLLVINSGGRTREPDASRTAAWDADHRAVGAFHCAGNPILGLHTAVATFPDWHGWSNIIGGRWGEDSHHPEMNEATFRPIPGTAGHPVWDGLESVTVIDERYCHLEVFDGSTPLVGHDTDGVSHVMGWAVGDAVVYDGLGHDGRSYESADRRRLLHNEVDWLLAHRLLTGTRVIA